ncbi:ABC transporter permease [Neobacillus sp. NPDC093182]|uniref:ABC transporter permease n=1 Tax=Neobacillus sp. NPDC093182 TaxID=3364297 RepID=UPI0037F7ADE1
MKSNIEKNNQALVVGPLMGPTTIIVTLMFLLPLIIFLRSSLNEFVPGQFMKTAWTLESFKNFLTDPFYLNILWRTFYISLSSTLLSLVLGFPVAYFLVRMKSKRKSMIIMLIVFPLLVGNMIRNVGWIALFSGSGLVNRWMMSLGFIQEPMQILQTPLSVIIAITNVVLPYMVLTLQSVLERIDPALEEAAYDLGASRWTVMKSIVLPLGMPGILAGTLFVFVLSMNSYTTPLVIGGPKVQMMAPALYSQITQASNWPMGAAMAFILIVFTLALSLVYLMIMEKFTGKTSAAGTEVKG